MSLFIDLLTGVLIIICLFLILLVLMQLPKKEAGLGQAFGNSTTDALFGAGSGNMLTKATKWFTGGFFALALFLSWWNSTHANTASRNASELQESLSKMHGTPSAPATTPEKPATSAATNSSVLTIAPESTNSALKLK